MVGALLVLHPGSSSLKFSVYLDDEPSQLLVRGQVEGLLGRPRFTARAAGSVAHSPYSLLVVGAIEDGDRTGRLGTNPSRR